MTAIIATVAEEIEKGGKVAVHCFGGKGRTGTVACAMAIKNWGMEPMDAIAWIREQRKGSLETTDQAEFLFNWYNACRRDRPEIVFSAADVEAKFSFKCNDRLKGKRRGKK